jgi:protein SCO1/2
MDLSGLRGKFPLAAALIVAALLAAPACRRVETPPEAVSASAARYLIQAVIRQINPDKPEMTLEHEEIPGFMAAMTMAFAVKADPGILRELKVGDRIAATLVVEGENSWIEGISAAPVATTLPAAVGTPVVTPKPNRSVGVGDPVPDFALTDQTGKTVRLSDMRGETVAVTFVYTRCPIATACPMTAAKFSKLDAMLREKPLGRLLVVTVEPEHDTPKVLAAYARKLGADPRRWKFLTGSPKAVAEVAESFGVLYYPDRGQIVHSQAVAVVDPAGRLSSIYYGERWEPEHLLRDMEKASRE